MGDDRGNVSVQSSSYEEIEITEVFQTAPLISQLSEQLQQTNPAVPTAPILSYLKTYEEWLDKFHRHFQQASIEELTISYASEWILDNYYLVRQAIQQIREDLPPGYLNQLPKSDTASYRGFPRVYLAIRSLLAIQQVQVDVGNLEDFLNRIQEQVPLTMGELWAMPIFLRYFVIESLTHALMHSIQPAAEAQLPTPQIETRVNDDEIVANCIISLRAISNQDWKDFFESVSLVDRTLRLDPMQTYGQMDFKSRDLYRKAVEEIAKKSHLPEREIASAALALARQAAGVESSSAGEDLREENDRSSHVGYYLLDKGRQILDQEIGYRPGLVETIGRWVEKHPIYPYLTGILFVTALILFGLSVYAATYTTSIWQILLVLLLTVIPALTISVNFIHWLITSLVPPKILPKLEYKEDQIPANLHTLVVIPAILASREEVESLAKQLELHYLRNPIDGLSFAILSDLTDADTEILPEDHTLIELARQRIEALNLKYPLPSGRTRFFLLHRKRLWNPSERKWMGWERKRGKLHELNRLLRGGTDLSFTETVGDLEELLTVRYVITLDADTILPRRGASELIGALAHPLNRAIFRRGSNHIAAGYTILQPRVEVNPQIAAHSEFTRIYSGDIGLDLYSLAVSDVYQDFFGEGIFVGKGIYDVDAFERSTTGCIPENRLLSHDLLEGLLGRAALVTDITLVEDYPTNYFSYIRRYHRWVRGDWQLLPWLFSVIGCPARLSAIDRWKIFDNLRRSLLAPSLMVLFLTAWMFLPGSWVIWILTGIISLSFPTLTDLINSLISLVRGKPIQTTIRSVRLDFLRMLLAIAFLPHEAGVALDALMITLYRVLITRQNFLEWVSAAHTALLFTQKNPRLTIWREMGGEFLLPPILAVLIGIVNPQDILPAIPFLLVWFLSPLIVIRLNRPIEKKIETLDEDDRLLIRMVARRTWGFFERFVGPEDHWLPPDHFQESPVGQVAHRTSPTNIGLLLTSTIAAYEFGYIDQFSLSARITETFDTLRQIERYRGHFPNWLDTRTLKPLVPRYISTVDSGNLAACMIVTANFLTGLRDAHVFRWQRWEGIRDTLLLLRDALGVLETEKPIPPFADLQKTLHDLQNRIQSVKRRSDLWYSFFEELSGPIWEHITQLISQIIESEEQGMDAEMLRRLLQVAQQVDLHLNGIQRTIRELVPWIPLLEQLPPLFTRVEFQEDMQTLRASLPYSPYFREIEGITMKASRIIDRIRAKTLHLVSENGDIESANSWLDELDTAVHRAADNANALLSDYAQIAEEAQQYVDEMDFTFLYDPFRRIFHIGYNLEAAQLDHNYYDLLASEARITSLIAIAKGDVPYEHWLHMNRPITDIDGHLVLLSWSATMFEYLMPPLFLRSYDGTLLEQSTTGAVLQQMNYGVAKGTPWGISESGFYRFDANLNYQYRAFGVPGLGLKRGLADDLVIAPYASLMAIGYQPRSVVQNIHRLIGLGMFGLYGFFEAIDFTENRLLVGQKYGIVRSYMSHHQGMILLALLNYLKGNLVVERMHADPRITSVDLLLQEQVPYATPVQNPESEDISGTQRLIPEPVEIKPWIVPIPTPIPQVHVLSNGTFNTLISNSSSGFCQWGDIDLTRWQPDDAEDRWGNWIYLQDLDAPPSHPSLTSIGNQPVPGQPDQMIVTYHSHMVVFRRTENELTMTMEVTVPPEDPVEVRRVHLSNPTDRIRHLQLTSYGEVILTSQANDARHPAFNKLFIDSEYVEDLNLLIFHRRPRSNQEKPVCLGHLLVLEDHAELTRAYETDRYRFIGRMRDIHNPLALKTKGYLSGTTGATLDPIFAIGQRLEIQPHTNIRLAWLTIAGESREEIIRLATHYRNWPVIERAYHQAHLTTESRLRRQNIDGDQLSQILQLLSALIYPISALRCDPEIIAANTRGQSSLWPFGISGDYPILLLRLHDPKRLDLVLEALQAHHYWRERGMKIDLVILNDQQSNYGAELNRLLHRLITRTNSDNWLNQRGGIFILYSDQMNNEERNLLLTAARVVLDGERGTLKDQLPGYTINVTHLPAFSPSRIVTEEEEATPPLPEVEPLQFFNGRGGFSMDGREYVVDLPPGTPSPLPWSNVIGYPEFGFLVTESGSSSTWALNSGENRLTPWSNDPVSDPSGEALYLRDEETGEIWTPTPMPAGTKERYRVRHGAGYTQFEHHSHGLRQRLRLYADPDDPVKIIHLHLENTWDHPRRITATQYVEWVLGVLRPTMQQYIIPEFLPEQNALLATNPYNVEFNQRVAFLSANQRVHGLTADRVEFIGRNGTLHAPIGLQRIGLESRVTPGENPCAILQLHIDLPPGGAEDVCFVLGQGQDRAHSLSLIDKYGSLEQADQAWNRTQAFWDRLLGAIQVSTPDPAADLMLNRWLLYQTLSCRIWGRTAFYQSSGAFGFRDQLQDVMALLPVSPDIARQQILNAAQRQFEEGDVLHWWHPPSGRGVRTRISDDLLWLPYVTAEYIQTTGDAAILNEKVSFLKAPLLQPDEDERYGEYPSTGKAYPLFEHCLRAIEKGSTRGPHDLPLIGSGDWNDGLNRVGAGGRGESVWLAWFLIETLERFAHLCELQNHPEDAEQYRQRAEAYRKAVEASAWDGEWYRRAYYDNGSPLGSVQNMECQIDSIAQSWAVLSHAGDPERSRQALSSVVERLVRRDDRLILLFTPPFDQTLRDPGYIKGYVPGTRENGGQYTHAAIWTVWAHARLGLGDLSYELFQLLNPVYQADKPESVDVYKVEPYVVSADIYSTPPHVRRGGWTWYTGSSGWLYRLGVEAILGLSVAGDHFSLNPVIPAQWESYDIAYRFKSSTYQIHVHNPEHVEKGIVQAVFDGKPISLDHIPLSEPNSAHTITVTLGKTGPGG